LERRSSSPRIADRDAGRARLWVVVLLAALLSCSGCASRRSGSPFSVPFGVDVGDVPVTSAQLDALGPVWFMDYNWDTPNLAGHSRLYVIRSWEVRADQGAIPSAMRASGSAWWSLGNEPNDPNQDNVSPEAYAELYHVFEGWAAQAGQCHILPAGIANADWNWAESFREAYRQKYGGYPRVDGWNIHNYILEQGLNSYDLAEFQRRILAFDRWTETIGDGQKPLFLTEFGVLYGNGCCNRPVDPPDKIIAFMHDTVGWLADSNVVTCWAWFASDANPYNGSLLTPDGQLNDLGAAYRDLVLKHGKIGETR